LICIRCSGVHRSLGTHVSRVRSVDLDTWTEEQVDVVEQMGNEKFNDIYEAFAPRDQKPSLNSSIPELEAWIKMKYVETKWKRYVSPVELEPIREGHFTEELEKMYGKEREELERQRSESASFDEDIVIVEVSEKKEDDETKKKNEVELPNATATKKDEVKPEAPERKQEQTTEQGKEEKAVPEPEKEQEKANNNEEKPERKKKKKKKKKASSETEGKKGKKKKTRKDVETPRKKTGKRKSKGKKKPRSQDTSIDNLKLDVDKLDKYSSSEEEDEKRNAHYEKV